MPWFVVTARQQITFKLKTEAERIAERIAEAKGIAKGNAYEKPSSVLVVSVGILAHFIR